VSDNPGEFTPFVAELKSLKKYQNQFGLSREAIFNAVDASLARLKTPYIDLLQIHRFDPETPPEETMKALNDLVVSGKVRYIGASSMRTWQFAMLQDTAEKNGWVKFVSMQNEVSLLYREEVRLPPRLSANILIWSLQEREMIPYCNYNGVGLIPWGPIAGGHLCRPVGTETTRGQLLAGSWRASESDADKEIIRRVEEVAKKFGKSMAQVALAWAESRCTSPIVGINSVKRLEENILGGWKLSEEDCRYLEEP
jgi:aryl-alcohol dehydrogenase-like predicted oxidoreductase